MDIFLYICNMEDEEVLEYWATFETPTYLSELNRLFGIGSLTDAYNKVESVKRLDEIGVHVTFYNRDKIIHNYGK